MNPNKLFPMIVSKDLPATRSFYLSLGAEIVHDMEDYLAFRFGEGDASPELCFMSTTAEGLGLPKEPFSGNSLLVSIPTPSSDEKHAELKQAGIDITLAPADRPWGWRSFVVSDPNGVRLDFFEVLPQSSASAAS